MLLRRGFLLFAPGTGEGRLDLVVVVDRRTLAGAGNGAGLGCQARRADGLLAAFDDAVFLFHAFRIAQRCIANQSEMGIDNRPHVV